MLQEKIMKNFQQGFIQIPILVAMLMGATVLGGTGYIAYEAGQKSSNDAPESADTSTTNNVQATTTEDIAETETVAETDVKTEKEQQTSAQSETETDTPAQPKTETSVDTFVNTESVPEPNEQVENTAQKVSTNALGSELLEFLNAQIAEQVKSDLDYYQRTISDLKDLIELQQNNASQGKQNCLASHESKIEYANDDAERQKTAYYQSRRGFASSPGIVEDIEKQLEQDLEDIERWKESCLAQYEVNTSVESRLNRVSSDLSSIQQRFNSSNSSVSTSEVNAVRNEITSIAGVLANSVGVSDNISLPTVQSIPSSVTCTDSVSGFSCRDNFGSNVMRCSQTSPGFLNCTDSNFNNVSCQTGAVPGSMRCSW